MVIRELLVRLGIDFDEKSAENADKHLESLIEKGKHLVEAFAIKEVADHLYELIKSSAEAADAVGKAAIRVGDSAEHLQELAFAAQKADVSQESLVHGLGFLSRAMAAASQGSSEIQGAFAKAGISIHDASGRLKAPTEVFKDLADRMFKIKDPAQRAAVSMQLLGRAGGEFLPLFKEGKAGLEEAAETLHALGGVFTDEFIEQSIRFNESLKDLGKVSQGILANFASKFLPVLQKVIDRFIEWYKINHKIVEQRLGEFFKALADIFGGLLQLLDPFIAILKVVIDGLSQLNSTLLIIGVTAGIIAAVAGAPFLAMAAAVVLALIALEDIYGFIVGKDSLIGRALHKLQEFIDELFKPLPDDSPLAAFFKDMAHDIMHVLFGLLDEVKSIMKTILTEPSRLVDHLSDLVARARGYGSHLLGELDQALPGQSLADINASFGNGASPYAAAASAVSSSTSSSSTSFAPQINAPISITVPPGTDAGELGDILDDHLNNTLRESYNTLVGEQR